MGSKNGKEIKAEVLNLSAGPKSKIAFNSFSLLHLKKDQPILNQEVKFL